jgi:rhomboid family GlyGly-CTERM serine protease
VAWAGVAALFAVCALLGFTVDRELLDWQPSLVSTEPWRAITAVGVHYSVAHLVGNVAGVAITGAFGVVARAPARLAGAWLVAWPLTQLGLLVKPSLLHYGGLSGVVHAGVAIVIVFLLAKGTRAQRWVAGLVLIGFIAKLINEAPWGPAVRHSESWGINVAPIVHLTGAVSGAVCAGILLMFSSRPRNDP